MTSNLIRKISHLKHYREWAPLPIRLISGWMLIAGVWEMALFMKPVGGVVTLFDQLGIPLLPFTAYLATYANFICGILFIIGLWIRPAALVMVFYFSVALLAAHTQDPIVKSFPAWGLWAIAISLSFFGGGKLSIDNLRGKRIIN